MSWSEFGGAEHAREDVRRNAEREREREKRRAVTDWER